MYIYIYIHRYNWLTYMYVSATYIYIHICEHAHVCPANGNWRSHIALRWRKKIGALGADMRPTEIGAVTLPYAGVRATRDLMQTQTQCQCVKLFQTLQAAAVNNLMHPIQIGYSTPHFALRWRKGNATAHAWITTPRRRAPRHFAIGFLASRSGGVRSGAQM